MVNVGIIGCGSISKHRHAPEYFANSNVNIVGFFDVVEDHAVALSKEFGGEVFSSLEELLDDKTIDAVSVCTPNKYHAPISIAAFKAGKHVLCEKPMATSKAEGEAMIEAAKAAGKFLMIGHSQRLAPAHIRAKQILDSGELGRILTFRTSFCHGGPEFWSIEGVKTWFFNKSESFVGAMGDLGVHKADLIRWLIGEEIVEANAFVSTLDKKNDKGTLIEVDDNAVCVLKSESGIIGTLCASWTYYGSEGNSTEIICSNGVMKIYADPEFPIVINKKSGEIVLYKIGQIQTNSSQTNSDVIGLFINSIVNNTPPEISGEEGLKALNIILACMESSETKNAIKINN